MKKTIVKIVPNKKTGAMVSVYKKSPEKGFIQLEQVTERMNAGGWIEDVKRTFLIKGRVETLTRIVKESKENAVPFSVEGQLVVKEFTESSVPDNLKKLFYDKTLSPEEQVKRHLKRAGENGPALRINGERIVKFTLLDSTGADSDVTIAHDNQAEIQAYNASKTNALSNARPSFPVNSEDEAEVEQETGG